MARILVTGGAGFIGSHIAVALREQGDEVVILDDLSTGYEENIEVAKPVKFYRGSVTDPKIVAEAVQGCDAVYHEAALASVPRSVAEPVPSNEANVSGTLNVLWQAKQAGVPRLIYAASSSAYGDSPTLPKVETMPTAPRSPYATSKLAGEHYVSNFAQVYGMQTVSLRYFNVFGPRQDPRSPYAAVIPIFADKLLDGEAPIINGDGGHSRDFSYIDNVVSANLKALSAPKLSGEVVNVACGAQTNLNELYEMIQEILDIRTPATYGPERVGDVRHSLADISLARELLGYEPVMGVREGMERTLAWYRKFRENSAKN